MTTPITSSGPVSLVGTIGVGLGLASNATFNILNAKCQALASSTAAGVTKLSNFYSKYGLYDEICFVNDTGSPNHTYNMALNQNNFFNGFPFTLVTASGYVAPLTMSITITDPTFNYHGNLHFKNLTDGGSADFAFAGASGGIATFTSNASPAGIISPGSKHIQIYPT